MAAEEGARNKNVAQKQLKHTTGHRNQSIRNVLQPRSKTSTKSNPKKKGKKPDERKRKLETPTKNEPKKKPDQRKHKLETPTKNASSKRQLQTPRSEAKRQKKGPKKCLMYIPKEYHDQWKKKCGLSLEKKVREEYKYAMNRALKKAQVSFKSFKIRLERRQFSMTPDEYVDELIAHGFGKQNPSARQRVMYVNKVMGRHKYEQSDEDSEEPNFEPKQVSDDEDSEDLELQDLLTLPKTKKEAKKEPLASILKRSAKAIKDAESTIQDVETTKSVSVANDMLGCCTHLSKHDLQKTLLAMANSKSIMQLAKMIQNTGKVALAWCQNSGKVALGWCQNSGKLV